MAANRPTPWPSMPPNSLLTQIPHFRGLVRIRKLALDTARHPTPRAPRDPFRSSPSNSHSHTLTLSHSHSCWRRRSIAPCQFAGFPLLLCKCSGVSGG